MAFHSLEFSFCQLAFLLSGIHSILFLLVMKAKPSTRIPKWPRVQFAPFWVQMYFDESQHKDFRFPRVFALTGIQELAGIQDFFPLLGLASDLPVAAQNTMKATPSTRIPDSPS